MEWQPIETCPLDEDVLICEGNNVYVAYLNSYLNSYNKKYKRKHCEWIVRCVCMNSEGADIVTPSHWMPLPQLPKELI